MLRLNLTVGEVRQRQYEASARNSQIEDFRSTATK